jgi:hypothetical protein
MTSVSIHVVTNEFLSFIMLVEKEGKMGKEKTVIEVYKILIRLKEHIPVTYGTPW